MKTKATLLTILVLALSFSLSTAQLTMPEIEWQNTIGGSSDDFLYSVQQTSDGGYILGGYSSSGISGDKTDTVLGSIDYWVLKLNSMGTIEWQNTIGGNDADYLLSVQQTSDGGYILGGYSYSGISGDKTEDLIGTKHRADYWVVKLDSNGLIEWQNTIGGSSDDFLSSVQQTSDGGYILGGYSGSDISGDKTEANQGPSFTYDYWVVKLNSTGAIEWQNTIGGSNVDDLISIQQTSDGGYILGGYSSSGISGDKTEASLGGNDYWVLKLNSTGTIEWQNTIGGNSEDILRSIQQTTDGGYILGGYSSSSISRDKTEASLGSTDYWVLKLNSTGAIEYQNTIGGNGGDILYSVKQTAGGGYILGGYSNSLISGDKTEGEKEEGNNYWVVKLNSTCAIEWQSTIGGIGTEFLYSIQQTSDGGYILGGASTSGISGDKTEPSSGAFDYWVVKLYPDCIDYLVFADADGDGFGDPNNSTLTANCIIPDGYLADSTDCNDADAMVHPNATEVCNGIDDDCNGLLDADDPNGILSVWYLDSDNDGFGSTGFAVLAVCMPPNFAGNSSDCNDGNPEIYPGATEVCNGIDDNCDGNIDEGTTFYADADGDGYGDPGSGVSTCDGAPDGYVPDNTDCNDADASINPGATEVCNSLDDNCNGLIDVLDPSLLLSTTAHWYYDADHDGYGSSLSVIACTQPPGYASLNGDCDNSNAAINPGASEVCNSIDDNCNGAVDDGVIQTFYLDADGDTYGNAASATLACSVPGGYVSDYADCDDGNSAVNPGATEVCNSIDDDCNGTPDDGLTFLTYYADADGDGYGSSADAGASLCSNPGAGYSPTNDDCDDANNGINPGATEVCNSTDDDCDGTADDGLTFLTYYADADGDGYGSSTDAGTSLCSNPGTGYSTSNNDCDDLNYYVNPGATEVCNGTDDDCDAQIDEGVKLTFYADADGDTYGNAASTTQACTAPGGYVSNTTDCNDANASIHPGASDICNSIDDNCNSVIDENAITATVAPAGSVNVCGGASLVLTANGGAGITYQWIKNTKNISGATNQTYSANKTADYKVKETNSFSCSSTSAATTVIVLATTTATITPLGNLDICGTGSVVLQANSGTGYTYQWMKGANNLAGATNQTYTATKAATYKVIVTNSSGCSKTSAGVKVTKSCRVGDEPISQEEAGASLDLYPNPASDIFVMDIKLNSSVEMPLEIDLLNALGQMIYSEKAIAVNGELKKEMTMPASASSGWYIVKVVLNDQVMEKKLLFEK